MSQMAWCRTVCISVYTELQDSFVQCCLQVHAYVPNIRNSLSISNNHRKRCRNVFLSYSFTLIHQPVCQHPKNYHEHCCGKLKVKEQTATFQLSCQSIKSTLSYINYVKKNPEQVSASKKDLLQLFAWFDERYAFAVTNTVDTLAPHKKCS